MFNWLKRKPVFNVHFNDGPVVEIKNSRKQFHIVFLHESEIIHQADIKGGEWTKAFRSYYTNWLIEIHSIDGNKIQSYQFDVDHQTIRINIDSKSLGDTLAWVPQVVAFSKMHTTSEIHLSHFWPKLIDITQYPRIQYCEPDSITENCYATYNLGYYFDDIQNKTPPGSENTVIG